MLLYYLLSVLYATPGALTSSLANNNDVTTLSPRALSESNFYVAYTRLERIIPEGSVVPYGLNQPLRKNGTWFDVGVWQRRKEIISQDPFIFSFGPGRNNDTYTIIPKEAPTKHLAYTERDYTLEVRFRTISAFVITDLGNSHARIMDDWTVEEDQHGRLLLGIGEVKREPGSFEGAMAGRGGEHWSLHQCIWNSPDNQFCDGGILYNCNGCYGTPAVVEVVEWKG
ncbi:hypothetical protein P154DRAFT_209885 [Amniculicola lignicola CBS 123094]|uniref:Uncharacterized protein n=1 Tax=Amniculicola lignicola CBS 123094 TaxID=1392246 RepID=A0A6A5WQF9_9PLEO|nr:hypothetical protein P154DRAFT_209885 [Amniculicola lignicola CBS 123094]